MFEDDTERVGRVLGYEMQVVCPGCGYATGADEISAEMPVRCGSDVPGSESHGCGVELIADVRSRELDGDHEMDGEIDG